jgi:hypothetical protein
MATSEHKAAVFGKALKGIAPRVVLADAQQHAELARKIASAQVPARREPPGLDAETLDWLAEKNAAPVATRDAVRALVDSVDSLTESMERTTRIQIWQNYVLVALTVLILVLTALVVF